MRVTPRGENALIIIFKDEFNEFPKQRTVSMQNMASNTNIISEM